MTTEPKHTPQKEAGFWVIEDVEKIIKERDTLLADNERLREALRACDKAFVSWQVGQIPGRPEDILALIAKARAALSATERTPCNP